MLQDNHWYIGIEPVGECYKQISPALRRPGPRVHLVQTYINVKLPHPKLRIHQVMTDIYFQVRTQCHDPTIRR